MWHRNMSENSSQESAVEEIEKCFNRISTKSMENRVRPLFNQLISKTVTEIVQSSRSIAEENSHIKHQILQACDDAILAGETICRILSHQSSDPLFTRISPSTSSGTGTDSGIDENDFDNNFDRYNDRENILTATSSREGRVYTNCSLSGNLAANKFDLLSLSSDLYPAYDYPHLSTSCVMLMTTIVTIFTLVDRIVVDEIILSKNKVVQSLSCLRSCDSFHEFMRDFSLFGERMINLAHLSGDRQKDLKNEIDRAKLSTIRSGLEKGTTLLLVSSKVEFCHPGSPMSHSLRDFCFENMQNALYRLDRIINKTETVHKTSDSKRRLEDLFSSSMRLETSPNKEESLFNCINNLKELVDNCKSKYQCGFFDPMTKTSLQQIDATLLKISNKVISFNECSLISRKQRSELITAHQHFRKSMHDYSLHKENWQQMDRITKPLLDSTVRLQTIAFDTAVQVCNEAISPLTCGRQSRSQDILEALIASAKSMSRHMDSHRALERFKNISLQIRGSCKLLWNCIEDESFSIEVGHIISNLNDLTEQTCQAFYLCESFPHSHVVYECLQSFATQWRSIPHSEIPALLASLNEKEIDRPRCKPEPLVKARGTTLDASEQTSAARMGLEIKLLSNQCGMECKHWGRNNEGVYTDVLRLVKNISDTSWNLYRFTRGEPPLRTTSDFFNVAMELGKTMNTFGGICKSAVNEIKLVRPDLYSEAFSTTTLLPVSCQGLQTTLRMTAHGKVAVFSKVMMTLRDVKSSLELVAKLTVLLHSISIKKNVSQTQQLLRTHKKRSKSLNPRHSRRRYPVIHENGEDNLSNCISQQGFVSANNNNNSCLTADTNISTAVCKDELSINNISFQENKQSSKIKLCGITFKSPTTV